MLGSIGSRMVGGLWFRSPPIVASMRPIPHEWRSAGRFSRSSAAALHLPRARFPPSPSSPASARAMRLQKRNSRTRSIRAVGNSYAVCTAAGTAFPMSAVGSGLRIGVSLMTRLPEEKMGVPCGTPKIGRRNVRLLNRLAVERQIEAVALDFDIDAEPDRHLDDLQDDERDDDVIG